MVKKYSLLFFFSLPTLVWAQKSVVIKGQIVVPDATPDKVLIVNLTSQKETQSDAAGNFAIEAQLDDLLVFSATHLDYMRKIIEQNHIDSGKIRVEMTSKNVMLEEVEIVNYSRINAVNLGILSKPAKKYTVAERRLYGATSSPIDNLINSFSGRKAMLQDAVQIERKQMAIKKIERLYQEKFFTETLRIDPDDVGGFKYYIVEDFKFMEALNGKNSFFVSFLMIKLASDYKAIRDAK